MHLYNKTRKMNFHVEQEWEQPGSFASSETWFLNGLMGRFNGPAYTERSRRNEHVIREEWLAAGNLHRLGNPAVVEYYEFRPTGVRYHGWWFEGRLHREDGPAEIWFDENGRAIKCMSWVRGRLKSFLIDLDAYSVFAKGVE